MAGEGKLLQAVHLHFGDSLKHSCSVGEKPGTRRGAPRPAGTEPQFFFAPTQVEKRRNDWGAEGFAKRYGEARSDFLPSTDDWMKVVPPG